MRLESKNERERDQTGITGRNNKESDRSDYGVSLEKIVEYYEKRVFYCTELGNEVQRRVYSGVLSVDR